MANKVTSPQSFQIKISRTVQPGNAARTTDKLGPKDVTTGGPTIPTSGVIWWPRK